jgi:hypothetical protein
MNTLKPKCLGSAKPKCLRSTKPKCLRSALYARNPVSISIQDRMDTVHKARYVGNKASFSVQKLNAFAIALRQTWDSRIHQYSLYWDN